jgi:hypothetical protein
MDPQHRLYVPLKFIFDRVTRHLTLSCLLLFAAGLLWFLSWPFLSRNAYFSENALAVGHHSPKYEYDDAQHALRISAELKQFFQKGGKEEMLRHLEHTLHNYGLETKRHEYLINRNFFNGTVKVRGTNLYASLRAPRGSGKESIILTAPLDAAKCDNMGLAVSLMRVMSTFKWLHHDFILVISDDGGIKSLKTGELAFIDSQIISTGRKRVAITLDFENFMFEKMAVLTEGVNGEVPNLDLVNTLIWLARHNDLSITLFEDVPRADGKMRIKNLPLPIYLYHKLLSTIDTFLDKLIKNKRLPIDEYKYRSVKDKFISGSMTLMQHVYNQLLGIPTGAHAWFRQRVTHALTLTNAKGPFDPNLSRQSFVNIKNVAKTIEGTFRSMNNLIEELHQSFFLYFLDSPVTYLGFEHYLPNLVLIGAPLIIQFVGNYFLSQKSRTVHSILLVVCAILCGFATYISPYWIVRLGVDTPRLLATWLLSIITFAFMLFSLVFPAIDVAYDSMLGNKKSLTEWRTLKAMAVGFSCFTMGVLVVFNTALYIASAFYLFLLCLCINTLDNERNFVLKLLQLISLVILSPFLVVTSLVLGRQYWLGDAISDQLKFLFEGGVVDIYTNSLYVTLTVVVLPVWLIFVKLVIDSMHKRLT